MIQTGQQGRKPGFGSLWHQQSALKPAPREPTVLLRLRSLSESPKTQEGNEIQTQRTERGSADRLRETCEGPLDLSERGKSKSNQSPADHSPLTLRGEEGVRSSPDGDLNLSAQRPEPTPNPPSSSFCSSPGKPQEEEPDPGLSQTVRTSPLLHLHLPKMRLCLRGRLHDNTTLE